MPVDLCIAFAQLPRSVSCLAGRLGRLLRQTAPRATRQRLGGRGRRAARSHRVRVTDRTRRHLPPWGRPGLDLATQRSPILGQLIDFPPSVRRRSAEAHLVQSPDPTTAALGDARQRLPSAATVPTAGVTGAAHPRGDQHHRIDECL
jgi:hypothetical protein